MIMADETRMMMSIRNIEQEMATIAQVAFEYSPQIHNAVRNTLDEMDKQIYKLIQSAKKIKEAEKER